MSTRYIGLGLAGLGIFLALSCSAWSITQPEGLGGRLFALIAAGVICAPLFIAGYVLYRRGQTEEREAARFEQARQILDRQRVAAEGWGQRLRAASARLGDAAGRDPVARESASRLTLLAESIGVGPNETAALSILANLKADAQADLTSADASFQAELARLEAAVAQLAGGGASSATVFEAIERVSRVHNHRQQLLSRAALPPAPSVQELLTFEVEGRFGAPGMAKVQPGDAVAYPGYNFLVVARAEYDDAGRSWLGFRLRAGSTNAWLQIEAGQPLLFTEQLKVDVAAARAMVANLPTCAIEGTTYRLRQHGLATATLTNAVGTRSGVLIEYRRYDAETGATYPYCLWGERIQDGDWTIWRGESASIGDFDIFPQAVSPA